MTWTIVKIAYVWIVEVDHFGLTHDETKASLFQNIFQFDAQVLTKINNTQFFAATMLER